MIKAFERSLCAKKRGRKGQLVIEYVVLFTVIVAVIIWASTRMVKPSVNRFFNSATKIIDNVSDTIDAQY